MRGAKAVLSLVCFFPLSLAGFAQEETRKEFSDYVKLKGYVKHMQTFQFLDLDYISHDNLVHNRLNLRVYPVEGLTLGLEVRNRIFTGEQVNYTANYVDLVDIDPGLVDLCWAPVQEQGIVAVSKVDRAWVNWSNPQWEITLGRQRINWGVNTFWNSNDLFNTFSLVDFDYEERPGSDALRVQRFFGSQRSLDVAIAPSQYDSTWIGAAMYRFNKWTYDFQFLAGWWNEDIAIGTGWAGNLGTASFKGEATYFHPQQNLADTSGVVSISVSADYVFTGNFYVMAGALYNSSGFDTTFNLSSLQNPALFSSSPPSAKNLMPMRYSALLNLSKPITPLITGSLVGIYSPGVNSMFLMPSLAFGVASNWEFALFGQLIWLDNGTVFKNYGNAVFARLKWGF